MKSWCEVKLKWAVDMLHQMFRPLFLFYRIASGFPRSFGGKWRWMVGESTKRRYLTGNASFHSSFCTLTNHPSRIFVGRTGRFFLSACLNQAYWDDDMTMTLFESSNIGPLSVKNRFVRSATWEGMADEDGSCTPKLVELTNELARGEVGADYFESRVRQSRGAGGAVAAWSVR